MITYGRLLDSGDFAEIESVVRDRQGEHQQLERTNEQHRAAVIRALAKRIEQLRQAIVTN